MAIHNEAIFPNSVVNRICKVTVLQAMHNALLNKGDVTIDELVQMKDAIQFARLWNSDEGLFFSVQETSKHCNAVLNIADRHFN
jgi:hypothetical protein